MKTINTTIILVLAICINGMIYASSPKNENPIASTYFINDFHLISIPVSLNGHDSLFFIIDTGFDVNVLDENVANALGLNLSEKISQDQPGGTIEFALVNNLELEINQVKIQNENFIVTPISQMANIVGFPIHGILGIDFLSKYLIEIDYESAQFIVHSLDSKIELKGFSELPVSLAEGEPFIYCDLQNSKGEPIKGKFKMDTGGIDAIGFNKNFIENNYIIDDNSKVQYKKGVAVGGETLGIEFRIKELSIANFEFENVLVGATMESGGFENRADAGTLGAEILCRFHWILDFSNSMSYLKPNKNIGAEFESDRSGLWIIENDEGEKIIFQILANTPAAQSGLESGQVVKQINGTNTNELSLFQIWEILRNPSTKSVILVIEGSNEPIEIVLTQLI
ncbi:MAG: hypothetical protein C0591_03575 [Marinilabiliales bacterium]|nr:MAG: hypothetical protein C0591_03575 [Marinilabiliales bacterium]